MKSSARPTLAGTRRTRLALSVLSSLAAAITASADTINKANNTTALSDTGSWTGGVVPGPDDIFAYTSANTGSSTAVSIGTGISVQGIEFTSNPGTNMVISANGSNSLTIGSSGINLRPSDFVSNRRFELSPLVVLGADQTWTPSDTGLGQNSILVQSSAIISGTGRLTIAGTGNAASGLVRINSASTYSGGFQLNEGGSFKVGVASVAAAGTVTSGAFGTGNVTINGGTLFGGVDSSAANIFINNDFTVNVGGTNTGNGRLGLGGAFDLGGATRTATLGRTFTTFAGAIASGSESFRLTAVSNGPAVSVSNGTLRVVSDSTTDWVQFGLQTTASFPANSGLTIGNKVVTYFANTDFLGTGANSATITVEDGGLFALSTSGAGSSRGQTIAGLNGAGTVTNLSTTAGNAPLILGSNNANGTFSGSIVDGASLNATTGLTSVGTVSVTKIGGGTQTFSGPNSYSGATTISAGTLAVGANNALSAISALSLASGATLDLNAFSASAASLGFNGGATLRFDLGAPANDTALLALTNAFTKSGSGVYSIALSGGEIGTYKLLSFGSTNFASVGDFTALLESGAAGSFSLSGDDLSFTFTSVAIPEPSAFAALAGLCVLGLASTRRRHLRA